MTRKLPNILITGTPGTGKTTTAELLALATGFTHINVSELVKSRGWHCGKDESYDSYIQDDDAIVDGLEEAMSNGRVILETHCIDYLPERWFSLVLLLTCDNSILYSRLQGRGYSDFKVSENVTAEIMRVIASEAYECYASDIILEKTSNSLEELEATVEQVSNIVESWN